MTNWLMFDLYDKIFFAGVIFLVICVIIALFVCYCIDRKLLNNISIDQPQPQPQPQTQSPSVITIHTIC